MDPAEFIQAAEAGDIEKVATGLHDGMKVDEPNQYGQTALMKASVAGRLEVVRFLVENGADVNLFTQFQWTALCYAATRDHFEVVEYLIKAGANVNAVCQDDITILEWVIKQQDNRVRMFKLLQQYGAETRPKTLLFAKKFYEDDIRKLIENPKNQSAGLPATKQAGQVTKSQGLAPASQDGQKSAGKDQKPWWKLW